MLWICFKMINETWNNVEAVFPYIRGCLLKYEMSMVCNCINIQMQRSAQEDLPRFTDYLNEKYSK